MLYHGGQVFGRSVNDPQSLAKTVLGIKQWKSVRNCWQLRKAWGISVQWISFSTRWTIFIGNDVVYERYGHYTAAMARGGLKVPSDRAVQWSIFTYILFSVVKTSVCRSSLCKLAMALSDTFKFHMELRHARILSNILIKKYCLASTPRSSKEPALKRLKLSDTL